MKKIKITTEEETITPAKAEEWYLLSGGNRPINKRLVAFLQDEMRTNWKLNGEAIIFDWDGKLIEGHHRLVAAGEGGLSFRSLVTRGVDPAAKATINTGRSRTGADALAYAGRGYVDNIVLATTIARLLDHDAGRLSSQSRIKHSNTDIVAKANACFGLEASVRGVRACRGIVAVTRLAWLHFLITKLHPEECADFFDRLADGLNMSSNSPIYQLRTRLTNAKMNRRIVPLNEGLALLVKAWNMFFRGKTVRVLRWDVSREDFPKIEGI